MSTYAGKRCEKASFGDSPHRRARFVVFATMAIFTYSHTIHGSFGVHTSLPPPRKRHLDRFSRFCKAHARDQHTDRQTDRHARSRSNTPHLALLSMLAMQAKNSQQEKQEPSSG